MRAAAVATVARAWYEMADRRRGGGGGGGGEGWPARDEDDDGEVEAVAAAGCSVLSGEYQAQEMSTMVSALTRVVVGHDDRWASEWPVAPFGGGGQWTGQEDLAMPHGYVHAQGSYSGAPTPEFAAGEDQYFYF